MLKIAHRGASAHAPENTLAAFHKAVALDADGIELDVHLCASGELVVIHDDTVDRTTNGRGRVARMTLAQLRALRMAKGGHIPTLEEVLETLGTDIYYYIEIKHKNAALPVADLIRRFVAKGWPADRLYLISFRHAALRVARKAFPALQVGASFKKLPVGYYRKATALGAAAIFPLYKSLTEAQVRRAHGSGLKVIPWTVNKASDIARMRAIGVDGIISDWPDRLTT